MRLGQEHLVNDLAPSRQKALLQQRNRHVPHGVTTAHLVVAVHAEGAHLWDVAGNNYIDFTGGLGTQNVGHSHPKVIQAVKAQLERYAHVAFQVAMYEPYIRLAEELNKIGPGKEQKKTILLTTGAEAVENAVKIARSYTGRPALISFHGAFHGRTLLGMSLTGKAQPYKQNFGPFAPEIYHTPFPYTYRGWTSERALEAFRDTLTATVAPDRVAAVVIEPVLGEGGFVPAPPLFLRELRKLTQEHGILLIADEIQSGFGRTGTMFAIEHSGVVPDLITVGKSLAGGLPLSAVIGRDNVMDAASPGGLGGTYSGNPLACAAALAVLDVLQSERLIERAQHVGHLLLKSFRALQEKYQFIGDVRGLGAMVAMELVNNHATQEPAPEIASAVVKAARESGLLLLKSGTFQNVIRVLVPLTIEEDDLLKAIKILDDSLYAQSLAVELGRGEKAC